MESTQTNYWKRFAQPPHPTCREGKGCRLPHVSGHWIGRGKPSFSFRKIWILEPQGGPQRVLKPSWSPFWSLPRDKRIQDGHGKPSLRLLESLWDAQGSILEPLGASMGAPKHPEDEFWRGFWRSKSVKKREWNIRFENDVLGYKFSMIFQSIL